MVFVEHVQNMRSGHIVQAVTDLQQLGRRHLRHCGLAHSTLRRTGMLEKFSGQVVESNVVVIG
jgi:hypothetical protein